MRLYEERLKLLQQIKEECFEQFNHGMCEDCPAFNKRYGGCYLCGEPMFWRVQAVNARQKRGGLANGNHA